MDNRFVKNQQSYSIITLDLEVLKFISLTTTYFYEIESSSERLDEGKSKTRPVVNLKRITISKSCVGPASYI